MVQLPGTLISVNRYLKVYLANAIATDNSIDAEEPRTILQSSIVRKGSKTSLDTRKQLTHRQTCGSLEQDLEANPDMAVSYTNTNEDIQSRRMEKIESDISWLLKNAKY